MKKAILYTRIDKGTIKPDQQLALQEKELREYCEANDIEVIKVIREIASGKDFNRPEFTSLHLAVRTGELNPDLLLFTSIHIFSEKISEVIRMHHQLLKFGVTTKAIQNVNVVFVGIISNND